MKILITGATGLVGTRLLETLFMKGYGDVNVLSRSPKKAEENSPFPINAFKWDPSKREIDHQALKNVDIIIHLAGESVAEGRWTKEKKEKILSSREDSTSLLMTAIGESGASPKKFIGASAIGIYGDRFEEALTEQSSNANGFLADVCKTWEELTLNHHINGMNSYAIRVGIVLANEGGALKKMLPPFKAGVAGNLGNGKQYMSWIHIDDLVGQFIYLLENEGKHQVYNGVSPEPLTNSAFTKILGKLLKRPTLFPVPAFALKLLFGEMSSILLASQKVIPQNFLNEGYKFKFSTLQEALKDILGAGLKGEEILQRYHYIPHKLDKVFNFFSDEKNLEKITPPHLNFKVLKKSTDQIQSGTLIDYKLKLHGFPLSWQSKINEFNEQKSFVDEQVKGPYDKWVHRHEFVPLDNGTLMSDRVVYKVPLGFLGRIFAGAFVRRDLKTIFNYRKKVISELLA